MTEEEKQAAQPVDEVMENEINETETSVKKEGKSLDKKQMTDLIEKLEAEKAELKEKAARAVADYQNLWRRQKDEQGKMIQAARAITFGSLLQPLNHLALAAQNLDNQGLNMVVNQFWQTLNEQGLQEIKPLGEKFDPMSMEAIEKVGEGETVKEVLAPGYKLNEQVIQVAKVKVG